MVYQTIGNIIIRADIPRRKPAAPIAGDIYFDEDLRKFLEYQEVDGGHGRGRGWVEIDIQDLELGTGC